ncbi:MAG: hypothetical protein RL017_546, partial [Pseudomonadota bacterium]
MQALPLFYFPPKVLCVDNDKDLLDILKYKLDLNYKVDTVTNPKEAIQIVKNCVSMVKYNFLKDLTVSYDYEGLDVTNRSVVEFNHSVILDIMNNPNRFNELGVIVIDYLMPEMNGIEFA